MTDPRHDDHTAGWALLGLSLCCISAAIVGCVAGWVARGVWG